jgi:membrane fusion protein (multidrug efflux system)
MNPKSDSSARKIEVEESTPSTDEVHGAHFSAHLGGQTRAVVLALAALFVAGSLGYYWFVYLERFITTDDAYIESDIFPVNSRIMGYMKDVPTIEGQFVHRSDVLASMDANDLEFEKSYKTMKVNKAVVDLKRAKTLHSSAAISGFDLENAEANSKASEVDLEGTNIKLRYMKVTAPSDGYIAKRSVAPGQYVQPGQTLFVLVDPSHPWVKASFKETQTHGLKVGLPVVVSIDAFPDHHFSGHIQSIYPSTNAKLSIIPAENATGNFTRIVQRVPVRISLDEIPKGLLLRPGMSARAEVDVRSKP